MRAALIDELPTGTLDDDTIARAVYMSARTLQRKLVDEGTSFTKLLDGVRCELAEHYIVDRSLNFNEISYLLGFSEPSAFSRAFKRWTGHSPTGYRDQRP